MGGGGIKDSQNQLKADASQQSGTASQLSGQGQDFLAKGAQYQAPLVNFLNSIISGSPTATNQALAPAIGNISHAASAAKEQIMDTTAPGAARDYALAQVPLQKNAQVAQLSNETYLNAFPTLAGLASGQFNLGTGLTNSGITSLGNSATTTNSVLGSQVQQKAATMGMISSLAGTAGSIATGGLMGGLGGGGGAGAAMPLPPSTTLRANPYSMIDPAGLVP